jgi:SAM-dependent methyltransferase
MPRRSTAQPRLFRDLAAWWHLFSGPDDYAEEARFYRRTLNRLCRPKTVLELGSGGGNSAAHLKRWFQLTLVDLSPEMIALSRSINPEVEHIRGDMRTLRLGRHFDAVFIHDAIMYMTAERDLRAAIATAYAHVRPGGVALFGPDCTRETFREDTLSGGKDGPDGRALRYLVWVSDPDPSDTHYTLDFAYLLREADGTVRVEQDRHLYNLFGRAQWLRFVREAGFRARAIAFDHSEAGRLTAFVGTKPGERSRRSTRR